jgi:hypothetical protein
MDWVWTRSRSRGNARLVLLAVADKAPDATATVRMGTAEMVRRVNAARSTVLDAVAAALASGELEITEAAAGSRAATYRIPGAVDYVRATGPKSGPQTHDTRGSESQTTNGYRSESQTTTAPASGPNPGPQPAEPEAGLWSESQTACGPNSGPLYHPIERVNEGVREEGPPSAVIPQFAEQLVGQITAARVYVPWNLTPGEWFKVDALIKRSGVDMLAAVAVRAATKKDVGHARYFLRAWQSLPALPAPGTVPAQPAGPGADVIPLAAGPRRQGRVATAQAMFAAAAGLDPQENVR